MNSNEIEKAIDRINLLDDKILLELFRPKRFITEALFDTVISKVKELGYLDEEDCQYFPEETKVDADKFDVVFSYLSKIAEGKKEVIDSGWLTEKVFFRYKDFVFKWTISFGQGSFCSLVAYPDNYVFEPDTTIIDVVVDESLKFL